MTRMNYDGWHPVRKALCKGFDEVQEAFRAVQSFDPRPESPSEVEQIGKNQFVVKTSIRYKVPGWGGPGFVVPSEIIVTTVSDERASAAAAMTTTSTSTTTAEWRGYGITDRDRGGWTEEDDGDEGGNGAAVRQRGRAVTASAALKGKVERIEERWNGARLLEGFPFDAMRRVVGMASFAFTPIFIPTSSSSSSSQRE